MWKVAADFAETPATSETLAIRFANSDSKPVQLHTESLVNVVLQMQMSSRKCLRKCR